MDTEKYKERIERYKNELPETAQDVFMLMINQNQRPKTAYAGLYYCLTDKTQREVAEELDTTNVTVRTSSQVARMLLKKYTSIEPKINTTTRKPTRKDYKMEILNKVEMDEDDYSMSSISSRVKEPRFKKSGYRKILEKLKGD